MISTAQRGQARRVSLILEGQHSGALTPHVEMGPERDTAPDQGHKQSKRSWPPVCKVLLFIALVGLALFGYNYTLKSRRRLLLFQDTFEACAKICCTDCDDDDDKCSVERVLFTIAYLTCLAPRCLLCCCVSVSDIWSCYTECKSKKEAEEEVVDDTHTNNTTEKKKMPGCCVGINKCEDACLCCSYNALVKKKGYYLGGCDQWVTGGAPVLGVMLGITSTVLSCTWLDENRKIGFTKDGETKVIKQGRYTSDGGFEKMEETPPEGLTLKDDDDSFMIMETEENQIVVKWDVYNEVKTLLDESDVSSAPENRSVEGTDRIAKHYVLTGNIEEAKNIINTKMGKRPNGNTFFVEEPSGRSTYKFNTRSQLIADNDEEIPVGWAEFVYETEPETNYDLIIAIVLIALFSLWALWLLIARFWRCCVKKECCK